MVNKSMDFFLKISITTHSAISFKCLLFIMALNLTPNTHALELDGVISQGSLISGYVDPVLKLKVMGKKVRVDSSGLYVFGLGRNAPPKITLTTSSIDGEIQRSYIFSVIQRKYKVQNIFGVPQKTVNPPAEVLDRIRREASEVRLARKIDTGTLDFLAGFKMPLRGKITGVYGSRRIYNGSPSNPHYGLDIAAQEGANVYAPAPGVVELVNESMFYSGGTLIIGHGHGVSSTFIHLSKVVVPLGKRVKKGDLIARVGSTGRSTGPHIDWRSNWFDVRLDPELVLRRFPSTDG